MHASTQGRISRLGSKRSEAHRFSRPPKPSGDVFDGKDTNLLCNLSAQWRTIICFFSRKKEKMGASVKKQCQVRNTKTWMNSLKSMKAESCSSTRERGNFCFFWHRISLANRNGTAAYPSWRNPHDHRFKQVHTQWTEMPGSTPAYNTREGDKRQICNHRIAFRETQDKYTIQNNEESKTDMAEYANLAVPVVYKSAEDFDKYNKQSDKKH